MKLKKVYNKYIPFKGFKAITILLWMLIREDCKDSLPWYYENHEQTHLLQEIEMLFIGFYLEYGVEYVLKLLVIFIIGLWHLCFDLDFKRAYMSLATEQEAYVHQEENDYNENRKHYAWTKYLFTLKPKEL